MVSQDLRSRLERRLDQADRIEERLASAQDSADHVRSQWRRWSHVAQLRATFGARAAARGRLCLAAQWVELQTTADRAARREHEALRAIERLCHLLELTAQFASADCEALQHEVNGILLRTTGPSGQARALNAHFNDPDLTYLETNPIRET
jgi:hypothetical protein